jgi:hypothetical protein
MSNTAVECAIADPKNEAEIRKSAIESEGNQRTMILLGSRLQAFSAKENDERLSVLSSFSIESSHTKSHSEKLSRLSRREGIGGKIT